MVTCCQRASRGKEFLGACTSQDLGNYVRERNGGLTNTKDIKSHKSALLSSVIARLVFDYKVVNDRFAYVKNAKQWHE